MKPVPRTSLVDRTEAAILAGIAAGKWQGMLPGVRLLCQSLEVSVPTVLAATARLIQKGVLRSRGTRRKLEIAGETARQRAAQPAEFARDSRRRVLCITDSELDRISHLSLEILSLLRMEPQWDLRHRVLPVKHAKFPRRQWDRVLATERPDNILVFGGTTVMAKWAHATGLPTVFAGGNPGTAPIPVVGVPPTLLLEEAFTELFRFGHRHICLPMFGLFPALENRLREIMSARLQEKGIPFRPRWHTPAAGQHDPDVVLNTMTSVAVERLPTAIICLSWTEFVTVECFLRERRLRIPADVSVVLLSGGPSLPWFRPALTHFSNPAAGHARLLRQWIKKGPPTEGGQFRVLGKLVPGDSIARPRG
jgi:DNA-binding LacI/PurR family transcriptional regulator